MSTANKDSAAAHWFAALNQRRSSAWDDLEQLRQEVDDDHPLRWAVDFIEAHETVEQQRQATALMVHFARFLDLGPYLFRRLLVDVARRRTMADRNVAPLALQQVARLIEPAEDPALLALVRGYQADELRVSGRGGQARMELDQVVRRLGRSDEMWAREIRATLLELQIDQANQRADHEAVESLLETVDELLRGLPVPGRRVETMWRRGRHLLAVNRDEEAHQVLTEAAERLLPDLDLHLHLDVLHLQAFAAAESGQPEVAAQLLDTVAPLVPDWGHPLLVAQQHFLKGQLARGEARYGEAAEHWRQALVLFADMDHFQDAQQTLDLLRRLWHRRMA